MPRSEKELQKLKNLGSAGTAYSFDYDPGHLEKVANAHSDRDYMVTLDCPEFTTLCPKTGQPDFGTIRIHYIPDKYIVESKSLKLYLFSFRNNGDFHEDCVNIILKDLVALLKPRYMEVEGLFRPRGGIRILPFSAYGKKGTPYEAEAKKRLFEHRIS